VQRWDRVWLAALIGEREVCDEALVEDRVD
jgi:hypothetical protein